METYLWALTADGNDRGGEGCVSAARHSHFAARLQLHWRRAFVSVKLSTNSDQSLPLLLIDQYIDRLETTLATGSYSKEGSIVLTSSTTRKGCRLC